MSGPAAGIWLQQVPEDAAILSLRNWLGESARFCGAASDFDLSEGWEFSARWPAALGDEPAEDPCLASLKLCLIDTEAEYSGGSYLSPADWARARQVLGWMPACELSVSVSYNRQRDHEVLGWLCVELATRFNGMIDLGGTLPLRERQFSRAPFAFTGRIMETVYELDAGRTSLMHIVDAELLRFWMSQPQFRMIK